MDTTYPKTLTVNQADLALRFFLTEFHEAHGLGYTSGQIDQFRRELSYRLCADFTASAPLEEAIQALQDLAHIETSTHLDLVENASGTVSNREQLIEDFESALNFAVHEALMDSGFAGALIVRTGERRLQCAA